MIFKCADSVKSRLNDYGTFLLVVKYAREIRHGGRLFISGFEVNIC